MPREHTGNDRPFNVDELMAELSEDVARRAPANGVIPTFAAQFTGFAPRDYFTVTPYVHDSTKPIVGPAVTKGKGMAARAAEPMVAALAEQVAVALSEIRMILDDILEDQARLKDTLAALARDVAALNDPQGEPPRRP